MANMDMDIFEDKRLNKTMIKCWIYLKIISNH